MMHDPVNVTDQQAGLRLRRVLIIGPTFPHEVVGFSGGNKYLFPGISGQEIIDMFHWLGRAHHQPGDHRQEVDAGARGRRRRGRDASRCDASA